MMLLLEVLLLAVVQGVAEFLPISSSGHLIITETLWETATDRDLPEIVMLSIVLHAGTLAAVMVVYWSRIWRLLGEDRRALGLLVVGTLPAVIVGLTIKRQFGEVLESTLLAGFMLPVTGAMLIAATWLRTGETPYTELSYGRALVIGLFQAVALLPGISRSGATIVGGLVVGLRRDAAATFSFLLALPATAGACILELRDLSSQESSPLPLWLLALGAVVSFLVGVAALRWLLAWLAQGKLYYFAWWCIPVGLAVIAWQLAGR